MRHISYYRKEYPRPQLWRDSYRLLNGTWNFAFGEGLSDEELQGGFDDRLSIKVPFTYQTSLSGIGTEERHDTVWYSRTLTVDKEQLEGRVIFHLEGCDYETFLFVNGLPMGSDTGGYHRLSFDITEAICEGENNITLKVCDDYSVEKPRGKQRSKDQNYGCWYTDTTGIYKTAWVEFVPKTYITELTVNPDRESASVSLECRTYGPSEDCGIEVSIIYEGRKIAEGRADVRFGSASLTALLDEDEPLHLWELDTPSLYELEIRLIKDGESVDKVNSYFGVRSIEIKDSKIYLNGRELYQKLALDQGYWRESLLTPPDEQALIDDIVDMRDMGFNGVRKHQKVEDERYLYYSDIMGFIVWSEMPSMYSNTPKSRKTFKREWLLAVEQNKNHPCILTWVPFNESWGIEKILTDSAVQDFANDVYYATKRADGTRPVVTNDGWEHTLSDILTIHHYEQDGAKLHSYYGSLEKCIAPKWESHHVGAFAQGYGYNGQPIIISEFGGTAFVKDTVGENWGYGVGVNDLEEFYARFGSLIEAIDSLPYSCGYCYTQVTDVQQEVNGLLDFDHKPKFDKERIKSILNKSGR